MEKEEPEKEKKEESGKRKREESVELSSSNEKGLGSDAKRENLRRN